MTHARVRWRDWEALRCVSGRCELIIGVSAGPRILSLRFADGPNLLYEDTTDFRVGEWCLHGGHRFTIAPESEGSYAPDNAPCAIATSAHALRVTAPRGTDGLRRAVEIRETLDAAGVDVLHHLSNDGSRPWRGALWAITCVPPVGLVVAPLGSLPPRLWPGAEALDWVCSPDHLAIRPNGGRAKAGWHSPAGWIAALQPSATLVLHSPDPPPAECCVDGGCNVEVFTCAHYMELETLGAELELAPGQSSVHVQRWRVLPPGPSPQDWRSIAAAARCPLIP